MNAKSFIISLLPPVITNVLRRLFSPGPLEPIRFTGDYASWEEAERASKGYAASEILAKTREAMLKVKNGEAAFERDSLVFTKMEFQFPLLAGLLRAAAADGGRLSVVDFGGALGSTYFQCRKFLPNLKGLRWSIVEQPAHVACGRVDFANEELRFYKTIDECLRFEQANLLLLSSVVQYLPTPYDFLKEVLHHEFRCVIIDRTAFLRNGRDRLTVEHVPAWIYKASYPSWFLSEDKFMECFQPHYRLIASFPALDKLHPDGGEADYKGFIFESEQSA